MKEFSLKGIFAPIVTPYKEDGNVDYSSLCEIAKYIFDNGVNGILVGGTNGEFANLTQEERINILKELRVAFPDKSLLFNVAATQKEELDSYIDKAKDIGADAITSTCPYFHRYDQEALFGYFSYIAERSQELPVYLYNIPAMSNNTISPTLLSRLTDKYSNIKGVKDSSMDLMTLLEYKQAVKREDFEISTGNDAEVMHALLSGATGGVIATASVFPALGALLYKAWEEKDLDKGMMIQSKIMAVRALFRSIMPIMTHKEALSLLGFKVGNARLPFRNLTLDEKKKVQKRLEELELI